MGFFTKDEEAKARRTQEREEQQKKENAVPPPYVHTPTHAMKDSLLSVPGAYKGTDAQRLKRAHKQRLEKETSALAAGSDTNVTNIPAKYWQGQPLPAQFKAPTPASLRELALSQPSLKGKKIELPIAPTAHKQSRTPTDEGKSSLFKLGHASVHSKKGTGKPSCALANDPSQEPEATQPKQQQAAEEGSVAELRRLRRRAREREGKQRSMQNRPSVFGFPSALTRLQAQNDSISKTPANVESVLVPRHSSGAKPGRDSSSDALKGQSSGWSPKVDSSTPPSSTSVRNRLSDHDGVTRYDWAFHWMRAAASTEEERAKLPPAVNPRQSPAPKAKTKSCYSSQDEFSRMSESAPKAKPSSNSSARRSNKAPGRIGFVSAESSAESSATVAGPKPKEDSSDLIEMSRPKSIGDFDFGFAPANTSTTTVVRSRPTERKRGRPETPSYSFMADQEFRLSAAMTPSPLNSDNYPSRQRRQANKAEARRKRS